MGQAFDAVVVGAGALGASVAFHLAALGQRVALVDRQQPATQTTPRAAGLAMQVLADDVLTRISMRSVVKLLSFKELTGQDLEVHRNGSLKLARREAEVAQIEEEISRGRRLGVAVSAVSPDEAQRLAPWLNARSAPAIWFAPNDVYLTPAELPLAYIRAAVAQGAEVYGDTVVTGIASANGVVTGVLTAQGRIDAPTVVIAAGAWTRALGELAGVQVPLWPVRHQLCITKPISGVEEHQATVRITDARTYCRPEKGGLLFGGYEADPLDIDPRSRPADFSIAQMELDFAPLRRKMEDIREEIPALLTAEITEHRGGLPTMTPDGYFIVDRAPQREGIWLLSGCNVGGVSNSPALGEDLATWIVSRERPGGIAPFGLARFDARFDDEQRLRQAGVRTYSHKYAGDEVAAGGPAAHSHAATDAA